MLTSGYQYGPSFRLIPSNIDGGLLNYAALPLSSLIYHECRNITRMYYARDHGPWRHSLALRVYTRKYAG